jgi:menaquinone-dependent protoporphyrinogen IX oxidase
MRVLVAYESNAGSTQEVARAIAESIGSEHVEVELKRLAELDDVGVYDAAVVGAPMIVGWHRGAVKFIRRHQDILSRIPVAYFMTALSLTDAGQDEEFDGIRIHRDPALLHEPTNPERLSFKEKHNSLGSYLRPVLKKTSKVRPLAIGLFAGKLDYRVLKFPQMVFVMLLFAQKPRDYRDWEQIRNWGAEIRTLYLAEQKEKE